MTQYISGKPSIRIKNLFNENKSNGSIFPLNQEKTYFFFSGRYALRAGIKALGIEPKDAILMPSYNCGVEIDPILNLGVDPVYYRITKNLLVDFDDLFEKITGRVKAILVTHFLGFPQPIEKIKQICIERNLYLIEDCAHALLSYHGGKPLGSYGDVSIFSFLKTLPVPDGGILLINNSDINYNHCSEKPNFFATSYYAAELLKCRTRSNGNSIKEKSLFLLSKGVYTSLSFTRLMLTGLRKYFNSKGLYLVKPDSYLFIGDLRSWGISDLSKRIINKTNFEEVKTIRRKNFEYLLNYFLKNDRGILPFTKLPSGVCPLFFPIIVENAEERDRLYTTLKGRGVISHPWWDRFHSEVPWNEYPDAVYLKTKLFGLPIHQDLTYKHLDRIIEEFEKAYQSK
jgi:dTDP-4-amino-4,6-dideoxygalactose transaminase